MRSRVRLEAAAGQRRAESVGLAEQVSAVVMSRAPLALTRSPFRQVGWRRVALGMKGACRKARVLCLVFADRMLKAVKEVEMGNYLICSTPVQGHVTPMLTMAADLVGRGHSVRMLTGRAFEDRVAASGALFEPLPAECDFDERDLDGAFPGRWEKKGLDRFRFDLEHIFFDTAPGQTRVMRELMAAEPVDAVLIDIGFGGALPLLLAGPEDRPPIIRAGITPLLFSSRDTAPYGFGKPPSSSPVGRLRNRALNAVTRRMFASSHRYANAMLRAQGVGKLPVFMLDATLLCDRYLQFCCPSFEYPRSDLPPHLSFVGPIQPSPPASFVPPAWWEDLDGGRPVVHVTQGTVDNLDLGRLVGPTLQALADRDVLVVATTGGRPAAEIPVPLPANARVAEFIPYAELLPRTSVMLTNGGYGGVQQALAYGIPLVVAGDSEDKPEVAARVAWSGTGINLRTGQPDPAAVRQAVDSILATDTYRRAAQGMAAEIANTAPLEALADALATVSPRPQPVARP